VRFASKATIGNTQMSTQNARSQGRRSRGGLRRRQNDEPTQAPTHTQSRYPSAPKPAKLTFWQKITAFFTGKKSSKPAARSNGTTAPATPRPEYQPRTTSGPATPAAPSRPVRKPEAVEVTSPKLYVGNLSFDATESDLSQLFNGVGVVKNAEIVSHKATEKSKGFGFVMMSTVEEAKRAVETLHDKEFMGRKLVVSGAKTNERSS
jgi:hypothetical protein